MAEADIETARHLTFEDLASTEPYHLAEIRYYFLVHMHIFSSF